MVMYPLSFFKALSDETRIRIVNLLLFHEFNVNELVEILKMGQSRISRHLKILTDCDIIEFRRDGLWVFYRPAAGGTGSEILSALGHFMEMEPHRDSDLKAADILSQKTRQETRLFFNAVAGAWGHMKHDIFGTFDAGTYLAGKITGCATLADLGCGTGDILLQLKEKADHVIGIDSSPNMLEQAKELGLDNHPGIELRLGEMEHLPLKDQEADSVLINMVLHHLSSPATVFTEISRVLKRPGELHILDFERHGDESFRTRFGDRRLGFSREEMITLCTDHSFAIEELEILPLEGGIHIMYIKATYAKEEKNGKE